MRIDQQLGLLQFFQKTFNNTSYQFQMKENIQSR